MSQVIDIKSTFSFNGWLCTQGLCQLIPANTNVQHLSPYMDVFLEETTKISPNISQTALPMQTSNTFDFLFLIFLLISSFLLLEKVSLGIKALKSSEN